MKSLKDKVVVITGAGSGIGRALALQAAAEGAIVAISDINEAGVKETAELARDAGAADVRSDVLDVADRARMQEYAASVASQFGRVNVVINNAGVTMTGDFEKVTYEQLEWIVGINFWGVVHGTKEFLPHLIASGDGHIVNISSLFGLISMPGQTSYNATKYAVRGFTEALREEMLIAGHPVGVTCVHPGGIKTGISRNGRVTEGEDKEAIDKLFEKSLARMEPSKAAEIIFTGIRKNKARVLVGIDAHLLHHFAKLTGSRYQDLVALASKRVLPAKVV